MKRSILLTLTIVLALLLGVIVHAQAQDEEQLKLNLNRDFGFSQGNRIQGTFTISISGPEDLDRVVFLIDDHTIGEAENAPFHIQFNTGSYSLGNHTISATGYTQDGRQLYATPVLIEFVSADEGWKTALKILVPVLVIIVGAALISFIGPWLLGRGKTKDLPLGAPRNYGVIGGTICPKCGRPFGMHLYGLNLLVGKLERCPYCGRWSIVRRALPGQLAEAEAAELEAATRAGQVPELSDEEKLRKSLEDSRYQNL